MDYSDMLLYSKDMYTCELQWATREGKAVKQRGYSKMDAFGSQIALMTCRRSMPKLYFKQIDWMEIEGLDLKKKNSTKKDEVGTQKGLSKCTTNTSRRIDKNLFQHLRVQKSGIAKDVEQTELPTPYITEKDQTHTNKKGTLSSIDTKDVKIQYAQGANIVKLMFSIFGKFVLSLPNNEHLVKLCAKLGNNLGYQYRSRRIVEVPRRYTYDVDLNGVDDVLNEYTFTEKKLQPPCKFTAKANDYLERYQNMLDLEAECTGSDVDIDVALIEECPEIVHFKEQDTTLPDETSDENLVDIIAMDSNDHIGDWCELSTVSDEVIPKMLNESDDSIHDALHGYSSTNIPEASEMQLESAHKRIISKLRMNVVPPTPISDAQSLKYMYKFSGKDVAGDYDPVKILSRTQMVLPRSPDVTIFTVIGIIERLALGQQVPAKESMKYEMLRFCTFRQYPPSGKPSTIRLAKAGFYYATNRDEVICYCCAKRISNWKENDDPLLAHKHVTPNCDFLLKNSEVNIPISITDESDVIQRLLRLESDPVFVNQVFNETSTEALERLNNLLTDSIGTDGRTNDDPSNIDVTSNTYRANRDSAVAKDNVPAGSFANSLPPVGAENMNDSERQYMSLVGEDVNNAAKLSTFNKMENMTGIMVSNMAKIPDFVNTKSVQPTDDSSTDLTRGLSTSSTTSSNSTQSTRALSQSNLAPQLPSTITSTLLPKSSHIPTTVNAANGVTVNSAVATTLPKYPKYSTRAARHASFRECQQIAVQIDLLCDAGFFYAGSGDSTRCFFCGIGLRHWSPDDDPWTEHARFSLKCLFVLEQKGQEFINIVKLAVEVSEKASKNAAVTNTDVMKSEAAVSALAMGYTAEQVRKAIDTINARMQTAAATNGNHQLSGQDILEEIFRLEEGSSTNSIVANIERHESEADNLEEQGAWAEAVPQRSQSDLLPLGSSRLQVQQRAASDSVVQSDLERKKKRLLQENKMLRSASLCTQCHRREICMVFLPCGHLVTCEECGKATRTCTTCASRVKGTVRTYMA